MRNFLIALGLIAAGIGAFYALQRPSYANYPLREGPIILFGDSLARGVGSTENSDIASVLAEKLKRPVEAMGVSGDTTEKALARLPEAVSRHPSVAIILLGGNDYLQKVPLDTTFTNLETIVDAFQNDGALVVVLGVRGGLIDDRYAPLYRSLAKEKNVVYVSDVLKNLLGNKLYMSDAVHPNDAGYAIIAERVFQALRPLY